MTRIAIVEDEAPCRQKLVDFLHRYEAEKGLCFQLKIYAEGEAFLADYAKACDLVFMDIQMPGLNGMDTARQLRQLDPQVGLVFVTTLAQYAISGYEVGALHYLLKPLRYHDFALKLTSVLQRLQQWERTLLLRTSKGLQRISLADIQYLEVSGHNVIYHTPHISIPRRCSLRQAKSELDDRFAQCSSSYLLNLACITAVYEDTVELGSVRLRISRPQKAAFLQCVQKYQEEHHV